MKNTLIYTTLTMLMAFIMGCSSKNDTGTIQIDNNGGSEITSSEKNLDDIQTSNNSLDSDHVVNKQEFIDEERGNFLLVGSNKIFLENIYFDFDQYTINDKNRDTVKRNALKLSTVNQNIRIKLEGNSDEWGTDEYNYALALKRVKSVKDALVEDGIASSSITMVSFGESNPTCNEKTVACWKKNRRVEYKLLP